MARFLCTIFPVGAFLRVFRCSQITRFFHNCKALTDFFVLLKLFWTLARILVFRWTSAGSIPETTQPLPMFFASERAKAFQASDLSWCELTLRFSTKFILRHSYQWLIRSSVSEHQRVVLINTLFQWLFRFRSQKHEPVVDHRISPLEMLEILQILFYSISTDQPLSNGAILNKIGAIVEEKQHNRKRLSIFCENSC